MSVNVLAMDKGKRKRGSPEPTMKRARFLPDLNQPFLPDLNYPPPPDYSDEEEQPLFVAQKNEVVWIHDEESTTGAATRKGKMIRKSESGSSSNWIKAYWNKVREYWITSKNKNDACSE
ncbi:uncharacterized protein LOC114917061 [Cajanus cajan]|uniref:uncharacterized protein LOC114917061 n=1 Tax=Cajanus cajan TaxID=3821 RepID=UPI0010FAF005|nr:uncharacterized protein LOC114917061 [Cajanus cajan]